MRFEKRNILDIDSLSREEIAYILDTARGMKEISQRAVKKVPTLRGKTIVLFFQEPSTRTKLSFELAGKRLSADTVAISKSSSSIVKGETLRDTVRTLESMKPDIIVMRHSSSGAAFQVAKWVKCAVINAGDGTHAHPSQALLDMMTIQEEKGSFEGLRVSLVGDISHSRVARSNIIGLSRMGAKVTICAPGTMIPIGIEQMGCTVARDMDACVAGADVVMMLRIQKERQGGSLLFPSEREYAALYGLNQARLALAAKDALIMHPGPLNRGVEISTLVADGEQSVILDQVTNGVALRMALFYLVSGGTKNADSN